MKLFRVLISNSVFVLNIVLVFLLFFRTGLHVPVWLQVAGRLHPMLVHLPIGFIILAAAMRLFRSGFKKKSFQNFLNFVLYLSALTAALTALAGLLLSAEGGYDQSQLTWHLTAGVAVSILSWCLLLVSLYTPHKKNTLDVMLALTTVVLLVAGHLGAVLTHGENFLWQPLSQQETATPSITDSTSLFTAVIHPILKTKCMSCHNDTKAKGGLVMTTTEKISKGGKHGLIWVAGDPGKSKIIHRIHLPESDDDHMPPSGKPQLSKADMRLLYLWIQAGASFTTSWTAIPKTDSLRILAEEFIHREQKPSVIHYTFPFASPETLEELNTPYCTVTQFATDEPAVKVDFFMATDFDSHKLENLLKIKDQVVNLNLAHMPLTEGDGKTIIQFKNLEKLNLNDVAMTARLLPLLKDLKKLKLLSLASTSVDKKMLEPLTQLPLLQQVFLWNTKVTPEDITSLQKQFPAVLWEAGYQSNEILRLTPPLLANDGTMLEDHEPVRLKHNLHGTQIRFTVNGADPDSLTSPVYSEPIQLSGYSVVKARAFKEGWYGSMPVQFYLFKKGIQSVTAKLLTSPNKDYKGEGAVTLTDHKKGSADNFRDIAWLGFREHPMSVLFHLEDQTPVRHVTFSYGKNNASFILAPASIELWSGDDPEKLKLVETISPPQAKEKDPVRVEGIVFNLPSSKARYFKIIAVPVARVPAFISKKPEKGWVFADEVIFD